MGTYQHHALLMEGRNGSATRDAFAAVLEFALALDAEDEVISGSLCGLLIRVPGVINEHVTYAMLPDGSKEGWSTSDRGDRLREYFKQTMAPHSYYGVVEVSWGECGESVTVTE